MSGAAVPMSSSGVAQRRCDGAAATTGSSAAMARCPSVWPSGISRIPAETRLAAKACRKAAKRRLRAERAVRRGRDADRDRQRDRSPTRRAANASSPACGHAARGRREEGARPAFRALERQSPRCRAKPPRASAISSRRASSPASAARQAAASSAASMRPAPVARALSRPSRPVRRGRRTSAASTAYSMPWL